DGGRRADLPRALSRARNGEPLLRGRAAIRIRVARRPGPRARPYQRTERPHGGPAGVEGPGAAGHAAFARRDDDVNGGSTMAATSGNLLNDRYDVPDEERAVVRQRETYEGLVQRLSHQSVVKHFDAYADIPWDDPAYQIDPDDPRWELSPDDSLGGTAWYRAQPAGVRSRIGLHMYATFMKLGVQFESVLKRGLLEYAAKLPNGAPEFRYAYHE